jgi:hypothetical protein
MTTPAHTPRGGSWLRQSRLENGAAGERDISAWRGKVIAASSNFKSSRQFGSNGQVLMNQP